MGTSDFIATLVVYVAALLTILSGLALVGIGAYLNADPSSNILLEGHYLIIGLYVCGAVLFVLGLLGIVAERSRNCFLVLLYIIGLTLVIGIELYMLFYIVTEKSSFDGYSLWKGLSFNKTENMQNLFGCCGYNSTFPRFINSSCTTETYCQDKIKDTYMSYMSLSIVLEVIFVVFQMFTLIAMSFLAGRSRDKRRLKHDREAPPARTVYETRQPPMDPRDPRDRARR